MLQFQCPHCTGVFQVDPTMAGQHVACPTCQGVVAIGSVEVAAVGHPGEPPLPASPPADVGQPPPYESQAAENVRPTVAAPSSLAELLGCPQCGGTFGTTLEMAGQQMACPHCGGVVTIPGESAPVGHGEAPPTPTEGLMAFRVHNQPKKIVMGDRVVEVRRLTAEEKAARRLIKRLVLIGVCGAILVGTIVFLLYRSGSKP